LSAHSGQIYYDTEKFVFATAANAGPGSHSFGTRMVIKHNGNVGIGTDNPTEDLHIKGTTPVIRLEDSDTSRQSQIVGIDGNLRFDADNGNAQADTNISFRTDGQERWKIDSSGHLLPGAAATYNIGSATAEIGHVYLADGKNVYLGSEQDMTMGFDSSNALISLNTGTLSIINYANNEDVKILSDNGGGGVVDYIVADGSTGEVLLNHYGSQKLATSTGITVTGEVAASQDYPSYRPEFDFNFAAVKKLDPRMTFTRTSEASFHDGIGSVKFVGYNVPRFDHDIVTGECKGLLVEPAGVNYSLYSRRFDVIASGSWVPQNGGATPTVTANTHTAPVIVSAEYILDVGVPSGAVCVFAVTVGVAPPF
jgi:hypothetical protein